MYEYFLNVFLHLCESDFRRENVSSIVIGTLGLLFEKASFRRILIFFFTQSVFLSSSSTNRSVPFEVQER